ncbi:carbohydrate ABC transporter permease [Glycomyces algeriensis]|jgi:putative aldouronate transport system permease protein|uniref:Sugar ABC transporter permease n=1 Tax=Glycomyces algeriensis TaxID=256037 RepID=A0A9W6LHC1_9ACTN|nr:carbohydrate ABC transporter permease [Glycomyces algeriensis]MDA1364399.1 carbohydrate ABC transporter permease [Glycomyces algeriensis]MDR7350432.1 putative aldouronate transport system permease protein [Glycomyces algeriensis]GLI43140.1 sugar ABC transporter permease [Glycomyces algeriensis]
MTLETATGAALGTEPESEPNRPKRRRPTPVQDTPVDRIFMVGVYILLTTFLLIVLIPLINILASSFSSPAAVSGGRVFLWPVDFTFVGYEAVLGNKAVLTGFGNSLFYAIVGTIVSVTLTVMIAYPLSRSELVGRKVLIGGVLFTMLFSGGLIPTYMVVRALGLLDTRWAIILPAAVGAWQVLIAMTFFRSSIPGELYEAAQLDGASDLRFLWSVVLPLSKPLLAVIALMYGIGQWNSYFSALIYLRSEELYPLQLVLRNILIVNNSAGTNLADQLAAQQMADLMKFSLIVISTVPVLLVYPFVARHFTKGVMLGSVKG